MTTFGRQLFRFAALALVAGAADAGDRNFVGGWVGVSTLSADGRTITSSERAEISSYKPENGLSGGVFAGHHLNGYFSVQGSYLRNSNSLLLTSSRSSAEEFLFYEQDRDVTMDSVVGELLIYVRPRRSRVRPYVSVGGGVVRLTSDEGSIAAQSPQAFEAPGRFSSLSPALRVAVGVDVALGKGWAFRFTFSETISSNTISEQLSPPGQRNLANFQNLFGFTKSF